MTPDTESWSLSICRDIVSATMTLQSAGFDFKEYGVQDSDGNKIKSFLWSLEKVAIKIEALRIISNSPEEPLVSAAEAARAVDEIWETSDKRSFEFEPSCRLMDHWLRTSDTGSRFHQSWRTIRTALHGDDFVLKEPSVADQLERIGNLLASMVKTSPSTR